MFAKVVIFAFVAVAAVAAQADKYPAGVHPASCPNYPYCDNTVVAHYQANPIAVPLAREYPAGVHPAACPNYPYCSSNIHPVTYAAFVPPAGVPVAARYPAGVHPSTCPNYPYCH